MSSVANPIKIIHCILTPIGAKTFLEPVAIALRGAGCDPELWTEFAPGSESILKQFTVPIKTLPLSTSVNLVRNFLSLLGFVKALRSARPRVLHAHQTRGSTIPLLAAFLCSVPVRIYHNHGLPYTGSKGLLRFALKSLENLNAALATHVLYVSDSTLEVARRDRIRKADRAELPGPGSIAGIDLTEFPAAILDPERVRACRAKWGVCPDAFTVGFVGRPTLRKGFFDLIEIWKRSNLASRGGALLIAGCTPAETAGAVDAVAHNVHALGSIRDMASFYAACDVVALPSWSEGFPYSLLEGAASGCVLIGYDVSGVRSAIFDGQNGYLVPAFDQAAFATRLLEVAGNPQLRLSLGQEARRLAESRFERSVVVNALVRWYATVPKLAP